MNFGISIGSLEIRRRTGTGFKPEHSQTCFYEALALIGAIQPLAQSKNATMAQLVLSWTSLQKGITVVLAGARNAKQAISNAGAMDFTFSADELQFIYTQLSKL